MSKKEIKCKQNSAQSFINTRDLNLILKYLKLTEQSIDLDDIPRVAQHQRCYVHNNEGNVKLHIAVKGCGAKVVNVN